LRAVFLIAPTAGLKADFSTANPTSAYDTANFGKVTDSPQRVPAVRSVGASESRGKDALTRHTVRARETRACTSSKPDQSSSCGWVELVVTLGRPRSSTRTSSPIPSPARAPRPLRRRLSRGLRAPTPTPRARSPTSPAGDGARRWTRPADSTCRRPGASKLSSSQEATSLLSLGHAPFSCSPRRDHLQDVTCFPDVA